MESRAAVRGARVELGGRRLALLDRARIYVCGITPYDVTHLGHAATFVWVDTLTRVLRRCADVASVVCRNVTDVDDVLARPGLDRATALALAAEFGGRQADPNKDDPFDTALWQAAEHEHQVWPSPWGPGRPAWHAECVAMSSSVLGVGLDVHAGGADLAFPHHAYHAAIAEAYTGVAPHTRAWFHVGTVHVNGAKMAKSAGNLVLLEDLLAEHPAAAVRMTVLDRPWRENWDYEPALLTAATERVRVLREAAAHPGPAHPAALEEVCRLLTHELDVPTAVDVAVEAGGDAARLLISVLGLP